MVYIGITRKSKRLCYLHTLESSAGEKGIKNFSITLPNTIHKDKLNMDKRPKCKTRNYKGKVTGKYGQNTQCHISKQDPL